MRLVFDAEMLDNTRGRVTLEFPDLQPMVIDNIPELRIVNPETSARRELTDAEIRDFENAIEEFVMLQTAKALRRYMRPGY